VATAFSHRRWYARKAEERAAGWDSRFVSLYRVERERAATRCTVGSEHLVGGLVVTDFERPPPAGAGSRGVTGLPRPEPRTVCGAWEIVAGIPGVPRAILFDP